MVATFEIKYSGARWFNYLALSVLINFIIANQINIQLPLQSIPVSEVLKINLMSLAKPKFQETQDVVNNISESAKNVEKKIITQKKAEKKVTKTESKDVTKTAKKQKSIKKEFTREKKEVVEKQKTKPAKEKYIAKSDEQEIKNIEVEKKPTIGLDSETVIQEAKYRKQVAPNYPRRAVELGQQGNVTLHAFVNKDGFPSELKIMQSSGFSLLDKAAIAAVSKWEFEPTNKNGITVASWVRVPIEFIIQ